MSVTHDRREPDQQLTASQHVRHARAGNQYQSSVMKFSANPCRKRLVIRLRPFTAVEEDQLAERSALITGPVVSDDRLSHCPHLRSETLLGVARPYALPAADLPAIYRPGQTKAGSADAATLRAARGSRWNPLSTLRHNSHRRR